tara:strand:+ start:289 stop:540 length:252 start_codon:yes stop_codon:yes gene_type:complete
MTIIAEPKGASWNEDDAHHVRVCDHLEAYWRRSDILEETIPTGMGSSAWIMPDHHVDGELVCPDCLERWLGAIVFTAYLDERA